MRVAVFAVLLSAVAAEEAENTNQMGLGVGFGALGTGFLVVLVLAGFGWWVKKHPEVVKEEVDAPVAQPRRKRSVHDMMHEDIAITIVPHAGKSGSESGSRSGSGSASHPAGSV